MKNLYLESVRGIATLLVFLTHLFALVPFLNKQRGHLTNLFCNWGTEAVIIFFVLSGLVITMSFEKRPKSFVNFIVSRIIRIHPILIITVTFSALVDILVFRNQFNVIQFVGNLIPAATMPSKTFSIYWKTNPVIWSLTFEVFFYLAFALLCLRNKKINTLRLRLWLALSFIAIFLRFSKLSPLQNSDSYFLEMLSFSCIWIIGVLIWKLRNILRSNFFLTAFCIGSLPLVSRVHILPAYYDPLKYFLFALMTWPLFQYLLVVNKTPKKEIPDNRKNPLLFASALIYCGCSVLMYNDNQYTLVIKGAYILLPLISLILLGAFKRFTIIVYYPFEKFLAFLGKISYSFYLIHFPIILLITLIDVSFMLQVLISVVVIPLIAYCLDLKLQPRVSRLLSKN